MKDTSYAIETELGILDGRDAIHIDSFQQKFNKLIFKGEINGKFCKEEYRHIRWYNVEFQFNGVKAYICENIDVYHWKEWATKSCFDEIVESKWKQTYNLPSDKYRNFILETYDYVYIILCESFDFIINGKR